jgi:diketogulonate reductase-like aldo/keto reductase
VDVNASRRDVLAAAGGLAAAAVMVGGGPAAAAGADDVITRAHPRTGQRVPVLGLGGFMTLDTLPGDRRDHLRAVVRGFWRAGGRLFDVSPLYGRAEENLGDLASELSISNRLFLTDKLWTTGEHLWDDSHAEASRRRSLRRLHRREPIDVLQCHSLVNVDVAIPLMHAWKKEGRIRSLGISHHDPAYYAVMTDWIRRGELDFVQVHYSIRTRAAEQSVLRAAADHGVGVLVNMPLEKARLHAVVGDRPLPSFALDFGLRTWSEYFLKWVIAHPAVTCAIAATSDPAHLAENVGALRGPLPDLHLRERMVRHMETIPGFSHLGTMPWYPGKTYRGLVARDQARMRARRPWWRS